MLSPTPVRVLVADTYPLVREGLKHLVQSQADLQLVGEAASVEEVETSCQQLRPQVLVINGHLPVRELVSRLRQQGVPCKVVMVALHLGEETIYRCLQAGVSGLVRLTSPTETLLEAIRTVGQGHKYLPDEVSIKLAQRLTRPSLTCREQEVLWKMAEGKSNLEIGRSLYISEGTVKSHVNSILTKLEVNDRTQAVLAALRSGLVSESLLYG